MTGDLTNRATGKLNFSEKFKAAPFEVLRCDPATGELKGLPTAWMQSLDVARLFVAFGYDIDTLRTYAVRASGGYVFTGEEFLEEHPAVAVIAAWTAGVLAVRAKQQDYLHTQWPALAMALDALEVKYGE